MPVSRKQEARALSADERTIVAKSRPPALQELSDAELAKLVRLVRERRDRARTMAARQRREMRGKARARGAAPARADQGSALKLAVLSMAARRLANEAERRRRVTAKSELMAPAFKTRTANPGLRPKENKRVKSLIRPGERGRLRKAQAVAQARKDARGHG